MNEIVKHDNLMMSAYNTEKSVNLRRFLNDSSDIDSILSPIERNVFDASLKTPIINIDDNTLLHKTASLFKYIAKDVGFLPSDASEWAYTCSRLLQFIKTYYCNLSLSEIKLSFEMLIAGELDEFLPKDKNGNPEKKHFQQFNIDYFGRILNAYCRKRINVLSKAYSLLPKYNTSSDEDRVIYHKHIVNICLHAYLCYKYTGVLRLRNIDDLFVYKWLLSIGYADDINETEKDRECAYNLYLKRAINGFVDKFTAFRVQKQGIYSAEIDSTVFIMARKRAIKCAFDQMIKDDIYIYNYINF